MELIVTIIILFVSLVLIWYILSWIFGSSKALTKMRKAMDQQVISTNDLPHSKDSNYTFSTWFYVDDWNYRYGEEKVLLARGKANPSIILGATTNDITVTIDCYKQSGPKGAHSGKKTASPHESTVYGSSVYGTATTQHKCIVQNFPLQKWVNLIISLYGRTLDIYVDGKLVRTCVLPGVAKIPDTTGGHGGDVFITPHG